MFNIFEEITWPQFRMLPAINKLSLTEQSQQYNQYLYQLSEARNNWISSQNKGPSIQIVGVLAQEDYFDILQEDGSSIFVTKFE